MSWKEATTIILSNWSWILITMLCVKPFGHFSWGECPELFSWLHCLFACYFYFLLAWRWGVRRIRQKKHPSTLTFITESRTFWSTEISLMIWITWRRSEVSGLVELNCKLNGEKSNIYLIMCNEIYKCEDDINYRINVK